MMELAKKINREEIIGKTDYDMPWNDTAMNKIW